MAEERQKTPNLETYLGWSIFSTLCCCLPLGIAAVVCSSKAQTAINNGDTAAAMKASSNAKRINIAALVCGLVLVVIFIYIQATQGHG